MCSIFWALSQNCEKRLYAASCLSVCLSTCNNSAPTGWIFMKFDFSVFFENLLRKFEFHLNLTRVTGTSHRAQYTFVIISRPFLLRMRNASDESCRENRNILLGLITFFQNSCHLCDNVEKILWSRTGHK